MKRKDPSSVMRNLFFATAVLSSSISALGADLPANPSLGFHATGVTVTQLEPGATVYLYSLSREPIGVTTKVVAREAKLVDDDRDGRIDWNLNDPLPWRSIFLAVEMKSGRYAAGAPPHYHQANRVSLTSDHLKRDGAGEITQFGFRGSVVEFILVRPKSSAVWGATIFSGSTSDEGMGTGKVRLSTVKLQPRGGTTEAPPNSLKNDDVLFMVTSFRAEYAAVRVGE